MLYFKGNDRQSLIRYWDRRQKKILIVRLIYELLELQGLVFKIANILTEFQGIQVQ